MDTKMARVEGGMPTMEVVLLAIDNPVLSLLRPANLRSSFPMFNVNQFICNSFLNRDELWRAILKLPLLGRKTRIPTKQHQANNGNARREMTFPGQGEWPGDGALCSVECAAPALHEGVRVVLICVAVAFTEPRELGTQLCGPGRWIDTCVYESGHRGAALVELVLTALKKTSASVNMRARWRWRV
jgi:hypothetical protein